MSTYLCRFCQSEHYQELYSGIRDWEYGVEGSYAYAQCRQCANVQMHPFPTLEQLKDAYSIDYHGYSSSDAKGVLFAAMYAVKDFLLKRNLKRFPVQGSRVLDVGCGCGEFLTQMKELGARETVGIDFSPFATEQVHKRGHTAYTGLFLDYPAEEGSFDLIFLNNYLEHTVNPHAELKKCFQLLKPGGALIGEIPGFDSWERRVFHRYWGGNHIPRHTFQYSFGFLTEQLHKVGFAKVQISHELNTGHLALSIQNLLQRKKTLHRNHLKGGRTWYYSWLLLIFIPLNIFAVLGKKSGVTKFYAFKT